MDYNQLAQDIISELKHNSCSDTEIATRLGISRQAYLRRRDNNQLTTEDITILSAWLVTGFGGGFYLNKYFAKTVSSSEQVPESNKDSVTTATPRTSKKNLQDVDKSASEEELRDKLENILVGSSSFCGCMEGDISGDGEEHYKEVIVELIKFIQSTLAQASAETERKSATQRAIVDADLSWCLGKLRGLGFPAPHLEEKYGITKFEEDQLRGQGGEK